MMLLFIIGHVKKHLTSNRCLRAAEAELVVAAIVHLSSPRELVFAGVVLFHAFCSTLIMTVLSSNKNSDIRVCSDRKLPEKKSGRR